MAKLNYFMIMLSLVIIFLCSLTTFAVSDEEEIKEVVTVDSVSLERYAGVWYEIAKIPNRFQRKCVKGTTATYTIRKDGRISVENRCFNKKSKIIKAQGIARVVDKKSNSKLKVSFVKIFGKSIFWGDYWILGLGNDYEYAVVGVPNRKYGWILARRPELPPETLELVYKILREQGYDPSDFVKTIHDSD